jgi:class 3 adenylate cyclase
MWAVCFTDLVNSTEQRVRLGDAAGDALRREHDAIVARAAATRGGVVVKGTGDGAMVAFPAAADAVDAAVAIQQLVDRRNRRGGERLALRVGISAGDLVHEADDLHGLAANEAARLCGLAEPGEILVSDLIRAMGGSRIAQELMPRGDFELKGMPSAVMVWSVAWEPAAEAAAIPFPDLLVSRDAMAFTGRVTELEWLMHVCEESASGQVRAVFVSGEPGVGKTRLVEEAARCAHDSETLVMYGRCEDRVGVPFHPFVEALDWYVGHSAEPELGEHGGDLIGICPAVGALAAASKPEHASDPEAEQYRLFTAVAGWLRAAASAQATVLVLDDLHWATEPTLLMLRHVLRTVHGVPLTVIGTYRDTDLDRRHPLGSMLADFRRAVGVERVQLRGLDEGEVVLLLERVATQDADDRTREFAYALHRETEGNPFFIAEVLRDLVATGRLVEREGRWTSDLSVDELGIPEGVTEAIGQRLDRLGNDVGDVLQVASVVGREFSVSTLEAIGPYGEDFVVRNLVAALDARLIEESGPDRYRFSHALVRSVLEEELPTSQRLRVHRRIAEYLEHVDLTSYSRIAYHWLEADVTGDPDRAIDAVIRAADLALASGAHEDAATLLRTATRYADDLTVSTSRRRALRLRLGEALACSWDPDAWPMLIGVAEEAYQAGATEELIRATLATHRGTTARTGFVDHERVRLYELAIDATGSARPSDRARLLAGLAVELGYDQPSRRVEAIDEALELAETTGDDVVLIDVDRAALIARWGEPAIEDRLLEDLETLRQQLDPRRQLMVHDIEHAIAAQRGDIEKSRTANDTCLRMAQDFGFTYFVWNALAWNACFEYLAGRLAEADAANTAQLQVAESSGQSDAMTIWGGIDLLISVDLDRIKERLALYLPLTESFAQGPAGNLVNATLAAGLLAAGDVDQARSYLDQETSAGFPMSETPLMRSLYLCCLSDAAIGLSDQAAARRLRHLLARDSGRCAFAGMLPLGAVDRYLGRLSTLLGLFDEAEQYLMAAEQLHERIRAPLYLARTWADQAELASHRHAPGDVGRAQRLVDEAVASARGHHAPGVERYARHVLAKP